jgi:hypothetical protein
MRNNFDFIFETIFHGMDSTVDCKEPGSISLRAKSLSPIKLEIGVVIEDRVVEQRQLSTME